MVIEAALLPSKANLAAGAPLPTSNATTNSKELNTFSLDHFFSVSLLLILFVGIPVAQSKVEMHPLLKQALASQISQEGQKAIAQQALGVLRIEPERRWMQIQWQRNAREVTNEQQHETLSVLSLLFLLSFSLSLLSLSSLSLFNLFLFHSFLLLR